MDFLIVICFPFVRERFGNVLSVYIQDERGDIWDVV